MKLDNPRKLILIGLILAVLGVVIPLLMVLDIIRSTFLMSLLAHATSVSGSFLGFIGTLMIVRYRKAKPLGERFQPSSWSDEPPPKR